MAKSIYDKIKTAKELLDEVSTRGFSTKDEDICRAQDILGHTSIDELDKLVNKNPTIFYYIAFKVWGWSDATEFWNKHTNKDHKIVEELREDIRLLEEQCKTYRSEVESLRKEIYDAREMAKAAAEKDHEILRLKARLYDMMTASA